MFSWRSGILPISVALLFGACSKDLPSAQVDGGAGDDTDGGAVSAPQGCPYTLTIPPSRGIKDFAPDDDQPAGDATGAAPLRVRLGLGGTTAAGQPGYPDPTTTAAFTWETTIKNTAAKVSLGTDPSSLTDVRAGFVWTTPPPKIGVGVNEPATFMHEVHACGLKAGTTYYYQVGGGAPGAEVWSATQSFTTVPASGKIVVGIMGDARDNVDVWQLAQKRMKNAAVNLQLFDGDIVDIGSEESLYTTWLNAIWKDPADKTKFLTLGQQMIVPIAGNHENEATRFFSAFAIPGDGPYAKTFASFNVGNTHFVMLDDEQIATSTGSAEAAAQLKWLDQDLAAANADRAAHPFIVVLSHRGLYSTSLHAADGDVLLARSKLAPLYDKYNVDLAINGHDHEYERSKPLHAGNPSSGDPVVQGPGAGTVYVICAGAGADPYFVGTTQVPYRETNTAFGTGTAYVGVYSIATLEGTKLALTAYGMKLAGGSVAGDDVIDTVVLTH
jgi:hypothetical protein